MTVITYIKKQYLFVFITIIILVLGCGSSRNLKVENLKQDSDLKVYLTDGNFYEGLVTQRTETEIIIVDKEDHRPHSVELRDIRRVEKSDNNYDYLAYLISEAELETYKSSKNAWGYAIGGAVLGGLAGLAIGIPFWAAEVNISPWFTAGLGAIAGSIYFAKKGVEKDTEIALDKVRYVRQREQELELEKLNEEKRLQELENEKENLKKELEVRRKDNTE